MNFPFPFWMYGVIEEALQSKLKKEMKLHNEKSYEMFKDNKWDKMGATNLTLKKVQDLRATHSQYVECMLFDAKLEVDKNEKRRKT